MNITLFLYLLQIRAFWRARACFKRVLFWVEARLFGIRYNLREEKSNYQSFRYLFRITQAQLLLAILFTALLQYIDPYLYPYYEVVSLKIPDNEEYVTLLATVSGIGGVFIGLYYAGITMVGGAIYARVPNNIRDLLAQERFGNVYMRFLSFLTFLGLSLIAFCILGYARIFLAVPVVTLGAGIGIVSFVKLGQRAFYLFDPTALSYHIFEQLQHWLTMVKPGGFRWEDRSFQAHAHKQAFSTLDTLETLADLTAKEPHLNGKPFAALAEDLLKFAVFYEQAKRYIPSDSHWYEQRYEHRDWYRTEDSHVSMAHQTGTTLAPHITSDKEWVEHRIIPILHRCIKVNLNENRYANILELFQYVDIYLQQLAKEGRVQRAFEILSELGDVILDHIAHHSDKDIEKDEVIEKLAIAEGLARWPIAILIAYREVLETYDRNKTSHELSRIRWENNRSIYQGHFPMYCLPRLEWFKPRLNFERAIEGTVVSPLWYQTELLLQVEVEQLKMNAEALIGRAASQYKRWIEKSLTAKHPWLAGAIMSREWEYWHKAGKYFEVFSEKWESVNQDRHIEGIPWPEYNFDSARARGRERQDELLKLMSQQSIMLSLLTRPEGFPDYSGQFLHTSGEVAFDALLNNNINRLRNVFEPYLYGCMLRFDSLRPKTSPKDWRTQQEIKIAAAALLDVMDISGYARLMADFHGNNDLWTVITSAWDKFLQQKSVQSPVPLLAASIALTETAFELPHRSILRTTWKQKIERRLEDVPRRELSHRGGRGLETVADHKSPLVRIFAPGPYGGFHDGIDIFIAFYLRGRKEAVDLNFGPRRPDLREKIEREERNYRDEGIGDSSHSYETSS